MKIFEMLATLLEYDRSKTAETLGPKLIQANQRDRKAELEKILEVLEACDPTRNKQYMMWIARQYIAGAFRLEDQPSVFDTLTTFESVKRRLTQRDINQYTLNSLRVAMRAATEVGDLGTDQAKTNATGGLPVIEGSTVLYNGPLGQLSIPKTKSASITLGHATSWCTARKDEGCMYDDYSDIAPLYIWIDKSGKKYQFWFGVLDPNYTSNNNDYNADGDVYDYPQLMDQDDQPLSTQVIKEMMNHPVLKRLFQRVIDKLSDIALVLIFMESVIGGPYPPLEHWITTPELALTYAVDIVKGPWPEGEPLIAKSRNASYQYANYVLRDRFPAGEKTISRSSTESLKYAKNIIKGRFPEGEDTISMESESAYEYARDIIKGPWPKGEPAIAENPRTAFVYASGIIKGPWLPGERSLKKNPYWARLYAHQVLKAPWPEAGIDGKRYELAGYGLLPAVPSMIGVR